MQLYRYFSSHAFETIRDARLMLAKPSTLNDPFEFVYKSAGQITMPKARQYIKGRMKSESFYHEFRKQHPSVRNKKGFKSLMRDKLEELSKNYFDRYDSITAVDPEGCHRLGDNNFRISSFSSLTVEPHEEILMWSHYAAKHSGVRMRFELSEEVKYPYFLKKVIYSKERVGLDLTSGAENEQSRSALIEAIRTKAEGWAYEREYRMFCLPAMCDDEVGSDGVTRSFMKFNPKVVSGIDFGIKCPPAEIKKIEDFVKSSHPHIELRRASHHKSAFAIEYIKI